MNRRFVVSIVGASAAVPLSLCACGSSGSSPSSSAPPTLKQEYPAMKSAAESANSVRVVGTVNKNGTTESLNMVVTRSGGLSGKVSEAGKSFTVLESGGKPYIEVNQSFLQAAHLPSSDCASLCGKWVAVPAGSMSELSNVGMQQLVGSVFQHGPTGAAANQRMTPTTYQGQAAWSAHGDGGTLYVASTGKPYLLGVTKGGQSVRFTDWNTATVPAPPPSKDVVRP